MVEYHYHIQKQCQTHRIIKLCVLIYDIRTYNKIILGFCLDRYIESKDQKSQI